MMKSHYIFFKKSTMHFITLSNYCCTCTVLCYWPTTGYLLHRCATLIKQIRLTTQSDVYLGQNGQKWPWILPTLILLGPMWDNSGLNFHKFCVPVSTFIGVMTAQYFITSRSWFLEHAFKNQWLPWTTVTLKCTAFYNGKFKMKGIATEVLQTFLDMPHIASTLSRQGKHKAGDSKGGKEDWSHLSKNKQQIGGTTDNNVQVSKVLAQHLIHWTKEPIRPHRQLVYIPIAILTSVQLPWFAIAEELGNDIYLQHCEMAF